MRNFGWTKARSAAEAAGASSALVCEAMVDRGAGAPVTVLKAGGLDLLDLMKEGLLAPDSLVNLRGAAGLDAIDVRPDGAARIGAMATLAKVAADERLRRWHPALVEAVSQSASPELRNVATLGGNLLQRPRCWYFRAIEFRCVRKGGGHCFALNGENQHHAVFDNASCAIVHPSTAATALVALGAEVALVDDGGQIRTLKLEDFFLGPERDLQRENDLKSHEVLTDVTLAAPPAARRSAHVKAAEKSSFDWPLVDVAVALDFSNDGLCITASVVLGAAAPTPHRAKAAEAALTGSRIDEATAARAGRAALEGATPLPKNAYKLALIETLVRRATLQAARI
jgi:xanthine dehydrogenase YagS FAD-binding subunit